VEFQPVCLASVCDPEVGLDQEKRGRWGAISRLKLECNMFQRIIAS
jgi:hypothetical protein